MKTGFSIILLASAVQGLFDRSAGGVIPLAFERRSVQAQSLRRRSALTAETTTGNNVLAYQVNATVGTPPQNLGLSLDTGSSDIILLTSESSFCKKNGPNACPIITAYNANKSSSYKYLNSNFSASFGFAAEGEGSGAAGDWATDTFTFAGAPIKNQQFAIAYGDPSIAFSILGLSYASGENPSTPTYNNLPLSMAASGATNLALFSLWQDKDTGHTGQILFGGIDQDTYSGDLVTLPIQTRPGLHDIVAFDILMTGFGLTANDSTKEVISNTGSQLTVIDCGTPFSIIQDSWAQPILDKFDIKYHSENDTAVVDCEVALMNFTIDYSFNGLTIKAPIGNFVSLFADGFCTFGIVPAGSRQALIGVNFLASSVVAFDLTNDQISIAQRDFTAQGEKVVAVPKDGVTALSSGSSSSSSSNTPSSSATASGGGSASQTETPSGSTTGSAPSSSTTKSDAPSGFSAGGHALAALVAISWLLVSL